MLGLDSEISIPFSHSNLSNSTQDLPLDTQCSSSTKNISTVHDPSAISQHKPSESQESKLQKIEELKKKLKNLEKKQQQSQHNFSTYIGALEKEVKRKEEINKELEEQVQEVKAEIEQSKNDINVLLNYLSKKKTQANDSNKKVQSPKKLKIYYMSKGKGSPKPRDQQKSPTIHKNKVFIK